MKICVVGTGYVGLVVGACFAEFGNEVWCVDIDKTKIEQLNDGQVPIYEPGLTDLVTRNAKYGRLHFTTKIKEGLQESQFAFIAVGTPQGEDGSADLSYVLQVAKDIGDNLDSYIVIIDKSTVPVGTAFKVKETVKKQLQKGGKSIQFDVVSNPEFLREGAAIEDFMDPSRIIIGTDNDRAAALMKELYQPLTEKGYPLYTMSVLSAELTKYATNAMLATRISFINEIASLCEVTGADIEEVKLGLGSDLRIGMSFLNAGLGYGGSCFPKDVKALMKTANEHQLSLKIIEAVEQVNAKQKTRLVEKVVEQFGDNLSNVTIAIWGLSFKPETDDVREAPSVEILKGLLEKGAIIQAYDPVATPNIMNLFGKVDRIKYLDDEYNALNGVDALLLVTEWNEFKHPDFKQMKRLMQKPIILDGRNQYDPNEMKKMGFKYYSVGRNDSN